MTDKDLTAPEAVERLAQRLDGAQCASGCGTMAFCVCAYAADCVDTLRALSAERDALKAELAGAVEGLINEAVSMADDNDEKVYVERRLRAFLTRHHAINADLCDPMQDERVKRLMEASARLVHVARQNTDDAVLWEKVCGDVNAALSALGEG